MRIAFLTFEFPDARPGGVGSYVLKCARALAVAGHQPHIFTLSVPDAVRERLPQGVALHEVQDIAQRVEAGTLPPVLAASALMGTQAAYKLLVGTLLCDALRSAHQAEPFDIVEAAECEGLALPLLVRPIGNLPVVVQIHLGWAANALGNSVDAGERDHLAEALELASIVGADGVCAATQNVVDVTKSVCPFQRPVEIIPHASAMASDRPFSLSPGDGAALFVGRLLRRKGYDVLASAANIFLKRNADATVRIAGSDTTSGPGKQSMLATMMDRLDVAVRDRFIYLGEISQAQVRQEVEACRFQLVPSLLENFANTAVDAMALGRLVVYGGNTGLDEVVGDSGIRVWPMTAELLAEKMELAWKNPTLASELGRRAFDRVRSRFSGAVVSQRRVEFFQRIIDEHNAGSSTRERQWNALSGPQIQAVLAALVWQMAGVAGLQLEIPTPGGLLTSGLLALARRLGRPPNVWLFGAGRFTMRLLGERYRWESVGLHIAGILDEHPRFEQTPVYLGYPVQKPQQLRDLIQQGLLVDAVVLSTDTLEEVFRERTRCFADLGVAVLGMSSDFAK